MNPVKASRIARQAHAGQQYGPHDYYEFHVLTVCDAILRDKHCNDDHLVAGYLHDVIEDTDITFSDLVNAGLALPQQLMLLALTRFDLEPYPNYIERVCSNVNAMLIKSHDLQANLKEGTPPELVDRYTEALRVITLRLDRCLKP